MPSHKSAILRDITYDSLTSMCICISYLCLVKMHNYHAIYVLIYYSRIRVKNLSFGLKYMYIHCVLLLCITDMTYMYYYAFLCTVYYY